MILPILSSPDLVHWTYRGDAITTKPAYRATTTRAWAPDIRYLNGGYHLTYALSNGGVALFTGATPLGPWTDHGLLVTPSGSGCPTGTIDQALFTDTDGTNYLYWGSYDTLCVQQLSADATARGGEVTQVGRGRRAEGSFVLHRGGFYYLFFSDAGCCDGAFSGYTVKVGRSTGPRGPFVTPSGLDLMALTSKDGIVLAANGNRWIGPGHNAIATDLAGQDWLVYHGISSADPDFGPVTGANGATLNLTKRPLLIDRLDRIDGWPVTARVAEPGLGARLPAYSDEFDGADPAWTWIRGANDSSLAGGALVWPTQNAELYTGTNTASVLTRNAPPGDFTVETKLTFDGTRGNQQAGLLLYQNDDRWFKLSHSVLPLSGTSEVTHQVEFGKEGERPTYSPPIAVANAPMFGGPAAGTAWLRLRYHYDAVNDEDEVREASSVDGTTWTWGGTWTQRHTGTYRIGLVSMNATGATAAFDYVRTYLNAADAVTCG